MNLFDAQIKNTELSGMLCNDAVVELLKDISNNPKNALFPEKVVLTGVRDRPMTIDEIEHCETVWLAEIARCPVRR